MSDYNYFANLIAAEISKLDTLAAGHPSDVVADNENKAQLPQ